MNILKIYNYPYFFINEQKLSFENYKIKDYAKYYVIYERLFFENLENNEIIKIINANINFDFLSSIYFKFSKLFLEVPIRLFLHIKLLKNDFDIHTINLQHLTNIEQNILNFYLKKEFPKITIIKNNLNKIYFLKFFLFSLIYLGILSLKYLFRKIPDITIEKNLTFSYPREYLYKNQNNITILIPFYNPLKKIKNSYNIINPLYYLRLKNIAKLIKIDFIILHNLLKTGNTYEIILGKYLFSYFQLLYLYMEIIEEKILKSYSGDIEFISANNEFACAINSIKNKKYTTYHKQHGQIQSPLPYRSNCDEFKAWTNYEKNLIKIYSKDKHYSSGYYPYFKAKNFDEKFYTPQNNKLSITIFTNIIDEIFGKIPYQNFLNIIKNFIEQYKYTFNIIIHIHPYEDKKFYKNNFPDIKIEQNKAEPILQTTDIIISVYSTIIVQALNYKKPIIVYNSFIDEENTFIGEIAYQRKFTNYNQLNKIIKSILEEYNKNKKINIEYEQYAFYKYFK